MILLTVFQQGRCYFCFLEKKRLMMKTTIITLILILGITTMTYSNDKYEKATFGAGCFWGVEDAFMQLEGVIETTVGYLGGTLEDPSYKDVCTDKTGPAEVVQIIFDPSKVSYEQLLELFWKIHNPTQLNRQGPDVGTQYRSAIFYHNEAQKQMAEKSKEALVQSGKYDRPVVTEITPASTFYKAEEYHQEYLKKNGHSSCHF